MNKIKILITIDCYLPTINGVIISVITLKKELEERGHQVKVLTLSKTTNSYKVDDIVYLGSMGVGNFYPGARFTFIRENNFIEELLLWKPDLIHSQSEFSTFSISKEIARELKIPIVHTYHTIYEDYTHYFSPVKKWGRLIAENITLKTLKYADLVIVPTKKISLLLLRYGVDKEINIIPTGINLKKFNKSTGLNSQDGLRKELKIPINHKVFIFVGRLGKEKNLEELILYLSRLERKDITLLIVGDGPHRKTLENYSKGNAFLNNIIFTGMIDPNEIGAYYKLGDVFVSASTSETQGLTYIEALANSLPLICREDQCLDDVIEEGINGFEYSTFEEFENSVNIVFSDNKIDLKKNALESVTKKFSSDLFAKRIEKSYQDTIKKYVGDHYKKK
nr:glycosyltransferase [Tissierella sp.]